MTKEIKILKMLNSEELICNIVNKGDPDILVVENIMKIVIMPAGKATTTATVGLTPWTSMFSSDEKFELDKKHITCIMTPNKQFMDEYERQTSSLLSVTKPPLIV